MFADDLWSSGGGDLRVGDASRLPCVFHLQQWSFFKPSGEIFELTFRRRRRFSSSNGFFSDGDCMLVTVGSLLLLEFIYLTASIHHQSFYSSKIHRQSFYSSKIHHRSFELAACMVRTGAIYPFVIQCPRTDPRRPTCFAVQVWLAILKTAARVGQARCDLLDDEPAAVWDETGEPNCHLLFPATTFHPVWTFVWIFLGFRVHWKHILLLFLKRI
ncbi:hypothetical protein IGI04_036332 [Brassica rapa subsp. trilocularis]|uniref:Uncharacterized protein n=1 Tax=Brassica rapa subsp. trilocularis TaxID=1813537 RepID=A0ABQ7LE73_BRACM|nr:hypothetical protein IGI04_036332 [Brassica rapa subsp. trilocularis]